MIPIRSKQLKSLADSLVANRASNGTYPVRPKISVEICRGAEV
jgi:hypothetical protein